MGVIKMCRIDSRLIHGQVATSMLRAISGKKVVIISDPLSKDAFQKQVLKLSCPSYCKFDLCSIEDAVKKFNDGSMMKEGNTAIVFQDIQSAYDAYMAGVKYPFLQIGGLRDDAPDRIMCSDQVKISPSEAKLVNEIAKAGVDVFIQQSAGVPKTQWDGIAKKYYPGV